MTKYELRLAAVIKVKKSDSIDEVFAFKICQQRIKEAEEYA